MLATDSSISGRAMRRLAIVTSAALVATAAGAVAYSWSGSTPPASAAQYALPSHTVALPMQEMPDEPLTFLKLEGVEGDSTVEGQVGAIELLSWELGASRNVAHSAGGGGGAGKVQMQDFHFTTKVSKATPKLFQLCANGQHIKTATLTLRKAGGGQQEYLIVKFSDLMISSYQMGGVSDDQIPVEQVSFVFGKLLIEYTPARGGGTEAEPVSASYERET